MKQKKTIYITTPIFYPSGNLHLGHLYSTTIAWSLANFKRKMNYDVFFTTGTDEHGQKIQEKALQTKKKPQEYVDSVSLNFKEFWKKMDIEYDLFTRTSNEKHKLFVENIFNKMLEKNYIYEGEYEGLYSVQDEEFVLEKDAIFKEGNFYHPDSKHILKTVKEPTFYFKMSKFKKWLIDFFDKNPEFIKNESAKKELLNSFLKEELKDLSVTRTTFDWGIKIRNKEPHVIYVWLDALFSYVSFLKNENLDGINLFEKYWKNGDEIVHVLGKEITRFHCIYWPIFLHSINYKIPTKMLVHGWLITNEGKMSKSKGNVIDPLNLIKEYDCEIVKLFLIAKTNSSLDSVFSEIELKNFYNSFLVNNISNLISRTIKMTKTNFLKPVTFKEKNLGSLEKELIEKIIKTKKIFIDEFDSFEIEKAYKSIIQFSDNINKYIDMTTPWLLKEQNEKLETILNMIYNGIYLVLLALEIVMPKAIKKFKKILNIKSDLSFSLVENFEKFDTLVPNDFEIIFSRRK